MGWSSVTAIGSLAGKDSIPASSTVVYLPGSAATVSAGSGRRSGRSLGLVMPAGTHKGCQRMREERGAAVDGAPLEAQLCAKTKIPLPLTGTKT